ncbi:hypothetical protein GCM10010207_39170 [Streptomyces atratus]|nr:hypothetical protein GCM10010207_39170 [Streptomyces atratus]
MQPPYLRIADELRRRIVEHVWEPGDRLPSRTQIGLADIVVPAAHCEIVYEIPINR